MCVRVRACVRARVYVGGDISFAFVSVLFLFCLGVFFRFCFCNFSVNLAFCIKGVLYS